MRAKLIIDDKIKEESCKEELCATTQPDDSVYAIKKAPVKSLRRQHLRKAMLLKEILGPPISRRQGANRRV